jgi:tripartite-type tricarboxylate transporter receptor subunit TctC
VPSTRSVSVAACCAATLLSTPALGAQSEPVSAYPSRPVRFICPFAPGAGTDLTARTIAQKLSEKWGEQFIVDNRTGAGGAIGVDTVAKAQPDGYTIGLISASNSVGAATNPTLPYNMEKDLQGVSQATSLFYVLYTQPAMPFRTVKELVAYAKANPGKLNFGSSGNYTLQHFSGELFNHLAKVQIVHIPYKGTAAVIPAMLAGEVQIGFGSLIGVRPQLQSGKLRGLAITAAKRVPSVDLPTIAESGLPGFEVDQWYGVIISSKVPQPLVKKLNDGSVEVVTGAAVATRLAADGSTPVGSSPDAFNKHIRAEIAKWKKLVAEAKLPLQK